MLIQENISLSQWTTFRIGGVARYWAVVKKIDELKQLIYWANQKEIKILILGGGSNILIGDYGFDGLVVKNEIEKLEILSENSSQAKILAGSGTTLNKLVNFSVENGLIGLEYLTGIPGTVGGAVFGNAGAYGKFVGDFVVRVRAFNLKSGEISVFSQNELMFSYRQSFFKKNQKWFIGEVEIGLKKGKSADESRKLIQRILAERYSKIPAGFSAGCIFKNYQIKKDDPLLKKFSEIKNKFSEQGIISAGYLIESVGLKGVRIGQAIVSPQHANFIINLGGAKASEIYQLINLIKQKIYDKFEIELNEEIIKL